MSRSIALTQILRQPDGTSSGVWGSHVLESAFQPIFAFHDGKLAIHAFEGLIRAFRNDETVAPTVFFGAVPAGDRLHVETLTRTLHLLNGGAFLDPPARLFVNFDPSVFGGREVAEAALREMRLVLHEAGLDPVRIVCEVTEQKSTSHGALETFVSALRAHGFSIAVDDFGAEESDMARISALRPDIVKFDARWIARLMDSRPGSALLRAMVRQFEDQGAKTVFEGIEEPWQLELADECGVSMVQGYALARPELAPACFAIVASAGSRQGDAGPRPGHRDGPAFAMAPPPSRPSQRPVRRPFGRRTA